MTQQSGLFVPFDKYFFLQLEEAWHDRFEKLEKTLLRSRRSTRLAEKCQASEPGTPSSPTRQKTGASMFLSDSAEETVLSGIALPEARRKTRMAQEESKIPDLTSLTEMVLEEAVQATKRHDVDGDGGKKNADADADDFLSRKTLTDVTNCPRRRSVLNQVKLAT